jgi:hypothetical protein
LSVKSEKEWTEWDSNWNIYRMAIKRGLFTCGFK